MAMAARPAFAPDRTRRGRRPHACDNRVLSSKILDEKNPAGAGFRLGFLETFEFEEHIKRLGCGFVQVAVAQCLQGNSQQRMKCCVW